MNKSKFDKFIDWLRQPSSKKAILIVLGLVGVAIQPDQWEAIMGVALGVYALISAFLDKN